jgi:hypothetical protein
VTTVIAGAGADGDVLDREAAGVRQFLAVVPGHELAQFHARAVHAEPDEVSRPRTPRIRDRLEVRQVAGQLEGLQPGWKRITEQVAEHQVGQGPRSSARPAKRRPGSGPAPGSPPMT